MFSVNYRQLTKCMTFAIAIAGIPEFSNAQIADFSDGLREAKPYVVSIEVDQGKKAKASEQLSSVGPGFDARSVQTGRLVTPNELIMELKPKTAARRYTYQRYADVVAGRNNSKQLQSGILFENSKGRKGILTLVSEEPKDTTKFKVNVDGEMKPIELSVFDGSTGVAILDLPANLDIETSISFSEDALEMGEPVALLWSQEDNSPFATYGMVSADPTWDSTNRRDVVYVDGKVKSGSLGGAVVDRNGNVAGIILGYLASPSQTPDTLSSTIVLPASSLSRAMQSHSSGVTKLNAGFLGVQLDSEEQDGEGVEVGMVRPESSAARAGIEAGERITRIEEQPINSAKELLSALGIFRAGDTVEIELNSDSESTKENRVVEATLGKMASELRIGQPVDATSAPRWLQPGQPLQTLQVAPLIYSEAMKAAAQKAQPKAKSTQTQQPKPLSYEAYSEIVRPYLSSEAKLQVERTDLEKAIRALTKQMQELEEKLDQVGARDKK